MSTHTIPVSVIIPSYNSERYLEDCIMSINSGHWPAEILIIDDCSTDNSFNLAIKLQSEYSNIRVLQTEKNGGAVVARRLGIINASQDLVALCDADDLLETDALAAAYNVIASSGADICIFDLWCFDEDKKWHHQANPQAFPKTGKEAALLTLGGWRIHPLGISLKSLYEEAYQEFHEKGFNADELLTRLVFSYASKVVGCEKKYFYRFHSASTTQTLNVRKLSALRSHLWLLNFASNFPDAPIKKMVCNAIWEAWFYWKNRRQIGEVETMDELRIFVPKITCFPRLWTWLWQSPKYFIGLLALSVFVWHSTLLRKTE